MKRFLASWALIAFLTATVGTTISCPHADVDLKTPSVVTIAGSGAAGAADGAAATASFMSPTGVVVARDGSVYVADALAQNIRRVRNGTVTTVAGSSPTEIWAGQRAGGFADGPAGRARFNQPTAVALSADGSIWVADSQNHAIRRIKNGVVSTFAGGSAGNRDGKGASAQFSDPEGLAADALGNLYVADRSVGIRKIAVDGSVTTLDLPDSANVCGLDVRTDAA